MAIVQAEFARDIRLGDYFMFVNKRRDRIKIMWWRQRMPIRSTGFRRMAVNHEPTNEAWKEPKWIFLHDLVI